MAGTHDRNKAKGEGLLYLRLPCLDRMQVEAIVHQLPSVKLGLKINKSGYDSLYFKGFILFFVFF